MAAAKGVKPPNAGKGRKKGTPNKVTGALKDMVLQALADAGGVQYLVTQAKENPNAFMGLVGRVLPLQVKQGGDDPKVPSSKLAIIDASGKQTVLSAGVGG
jgi:hypothetical protein